MSCPGAPHTSNNVPLTSEKTDVLSRYRTPKCSSQLPLVCNLPPFCEPDSMQLMLMTSDPKCLEGKIECKVPVFYQKPPPCWNWSRKEVGDWLERAGYGRYRKMFDQLNIDGKKLAESGAHDFRRMGLRNWEDCRGIAEAGTEVTGRKILLNPNDYKDKIYPYYPSLYLCRDNCLPPIGDTNTEKSGLAKRKAVFRHVYKSADGQCFYYDAHKPHF